MNRDLNTSDIPSFEFSNQRDIVLFLIYKELQDINIQNHFSQVGLDFSSLGVDLGELILSMLGFDEKSDALWESYYETMNQHADQFTQEPHEITILNCYNALKDC